MGKRLHIDPAAEREANEIAFQFMNSSDVVGDMSRTYGQELSNVRIHTGEDAARRTAPTGADAFSTGRDIFFARGAFNQSDPASRGLLAHELAHSLQQGGGEVRQSVPEGAPQGGLLDWFRSKFGRKKPQEMQISGPLSVERNESAESLDYMEKMRGALMTAGDVPDRIPEARPGQTDQSKFASFQDAFLGSGAAVANSNRAFQSHDRDTALVELGIRNSGSAQGRADKAFRGSLMNNVNGDYATYLHNLESGGMDLGRALNDTTKQSINTGGKQSAAAFVTGGKIDQISSDMLSMFSQYAESDEGISYLRQAVGTLGGADVFQGSQQDALQYMMRCMLTTSNHAGVAAQQDTYKNGGAALNVAREACRTLLALPTLSEMPPEARSALPPTIQPLIAQYQSLIERIQGRLGGQ